MNTNIFYNCDVIFIEYSDILRSPSLTILNLIQHNDKLKEILDLNPILGLNDKSMLEWYVNRKHRNIFKELANIELDDEFVNGLLSTYINADKRVIDMTKPLPFQNALESLIRQKIVKNVIVYNDFDSEFIKEDIKEIVRETQFKFVYGDFKECIKNLSGDITYVLSDIEKVGIINETNGLELSTIIIPQEYRYNKINMSDFKIDLEELGKDIVFKYGYIKTIYNL